MKRKTIFILLFALFLVVLCLVDFYTNKLTYQKNHEQSERVLKIAHELVDVESDSKTHQETGKVADISGKNENDILGVLYIDKLNIEAPIKEGTSQEVMKTSVGHFVESDIWNGNVSLASHNSGTSMHYFKDLDKLQVDDEIKYKTELGEKVYKVQTIERIRDTDWSKVVRNKTGESNTVTLITCINGQPDYRLCVQGKEI